jgi:hypothetical protein
MEFPQNCRRGARAPPVAGLAYILWPPSGRRTGGPQSVSEFGPGSAGSSTVGASTSAISFALNSRAWRATAMEDQPLGRSSRCASLVALATHTCTWPASTVPLCVRGGRRGNSNVTAYVAFISPPRVCRDRDAPGSRPFRRRASPRVCQLTGLALSCGCGAFCTGPRGSWDPRSGRGPPGGARCDAHPRRPYSAPHASTRRRTD